MINRIAKIKNLGIFSEYQEDSTLPEFKRFNLIYGWNGSGKTTLSQLFALLESGRSEIYPELEYKIQTDTGYITQNNAYNRKVRVFNRDFVSSNIDVVFGKAKPIFIIGEENKKLVEEIKKDEKILNGDPEKPDDIGKIRELELKKKELSKKEEEKGKCFTDVAKIISTETSGVLARTYRKNNAEQAFSRLETKQKINEDIKRIYSLTLRQSEKAIIDELSIEDIDKKAKEIVREAKSILKRTVESAIIQRLKDNPDISKWVEQGIVLHKKYSLSCCEFCNQPLPPQRISELMAFFNDADKQLKDDIDALEIEIDMLYDTVKKVAAVDKANLYDELQSNYLVVVNKFNPLKKDVLINISSLKGELEKKRINTSLPLELFSDITTESFVSALGAINAEIRKHNSKTTNFVQAKTEATEKLEKHCLSEIFDEVKALEADIVRINQEIVQLENGNPQDPANPGIILIQNRIQENKNKISTSGTACKEINERLKAFLGREELIFEVADEGGYFIKRKDKIAKNLSEGEKTAITFVYFTIHLRDQGFNIKDGIVVIDDPVCSLDSNTQYQAFAFLKNTVKESSQVFIFTHNFDFLRLLLGWLKHGKMKQQSEFYMVNNYFDNNIRRAKIERLDQLLKEHESEYQYLFKCLYIYKSDGTIASVYHVPNIARKVLEYFLMMMVPNSDNTYSKLEAIIFDEIKKTAIYKFTNNQSHFTGKGFDPSLVPETQNNVKHLLEMIESVFPGHYKILVDSIGLSTQ